MEVLDCWKGQRSPLRVFEAGGGTGIPAITRLRPFMVSADGSESEELLAHPGTTDVSGSTYTRTIRDENVPAGFSRRNIVLDKSVLASV